MVLELIMQKKSQFLQAFRTSALIFLCLLAFSTPLCAQQPLNPLQYGEVTSFKFLPEPKELPDFPFQDAGGQTVNLSRFRGKLVLLTLWATWCPYCARELPTLEKTQDAIGKEKFLVLPISVDKEGPSLVKKYLEEKSLNFPAYADPRDSISKILGTRGVPVSVLIDASGRQIGSIYGEVNWAAPESIKLLSAFLP